MKQFTQYLIFSALLLSAALSCSKEPVGADTLETDVVIPVSLEQSGIGTRVDTDGSSGDLTWTRGDRIGIFVSDGDTYNKYKYATVVDGSVRLTLADGQYRTGYAVYPYENLDADNVGVGEGSELHINYPTTYNYGVLTPAQIATYSPLPMVADNSTTELRFYNVGGLFRLKVTGVPVGTTTIVVTFVGMEHVTGNYTVVNPGQHTPTCTYASGGGNTVTFNDLHLGEEQTLILNIPLPPQDYSSMTSITVAATGGTSRSIKRIIGPEERWNPVGRSEGVKMTIGLDEEYIAISGRLDTYRGYYITPGVMKWDEAANGGAGGYVITDGDDPLDMLNYYKHDDALDVYYHMWRRTGDGDNTKTMKYRFDGNNNDTDALLRPYVEKDGLTWIVPSQTDYDTIFSGAPTQPITINNEVAADKANNARVILVDITNTDYAGKGNSNADGNRAEGTNYARGTLVIPDGCTISCTRISPISYAGLQKLIAGGCLFLVSAGGHRDGDWFLGHAGTATTLYWTRTKIGSGLSDLMYDAGLCGGYVATWWNFRQNHYYPVRLVRTVE